MDAEYRRQIEEQLGLVRMMHKNGEMPVNVYHKSVVALAYEYFNADDLATGCETLLLVPMSYFQEVQVQHMLDDALYAQWCQLIAQKLVMNGKAEDSTLLGFMQRQAQA